MSSYEEWGETAPMPTATEPLSPKGIIDFEATRPRIVSTNVEHKLQQQQQVSIDCRTFEVAVNDNKMRELRFGLLARNGNNFNNNRRNVNANQQPSNRLEMASKSIKKIEKHMFDKITSYENLLLAYQKAKKNKTKKSYVIEFEKNYRNELFKLQWELLTHTYQPKKLTTFTVRDPKTRKISASAFRDRVVHHAIINQIGPVFERRFIHDTYANRIGMGTKAAVERYVKFMRRVSRNGRQILGARNNNQIVGYALKADISKYFESVDHGVLFSILSKRIKDADALDLVGAILKNHKTKVSGRGMPLGNLTSQFLANVYLSELDEFVKNQLRAKFYLRYVDDFIILSANRNDLVRYHTAINEFLSSRLKLTLHPQKTKITPLSSGLTLLGFRQFYHYRLLKKSNQRRIYSRIERFKSIASQSGGGGVSLESICG